MKSKVSSIILECPNCGSTLNVIDQLTNEQAWMLCPYCDKGYVLTFKWEKLDIG